jgi:hypothetical protein
MIYRELSNTDKRRTAMRKMPKIEKLKLSRETLRNLEKGELTLVDGGATVTMCSNSCSKLYSCIC